jgi:hypothetical protein
MAGASVGTSVAGSVATASVRASVAGTLVSTGACVTAGVAPQALTRIVSTRETKKILNLLTI